MMTSILLDHWVSDNNLPTRLQYGKGWWHYIETLRRLAEKFEVEHARARLGRGG